MRGPGNGLTYPSLDDSVGANGVHIRRNALLMQVLVRNATPARANDPAWNHVGQFARDSLIVIENAFIGAKRSYMSGE